MSHSDDSNGDDVDEDDVNLCSAFGINAEVIPFSTQLNVKGLAMTLKAFSVEKRGWEVWGGGGGGNDTDSNHTILSVSQYIIEHEKLLEEEVRRRRIWRKRRS